MRNNDTLDTLITMAHSYSANGYDRAAYRLGLHAGKRAARQGLALADMSDRCVTDDAVWSGVVDGYYMAM